VRLNQFDTLSGVDERSMSVQQSLQAYRGQKEDAADAFALSSYRSVG
jgi:hypothetical protein